MATPTVSKASKPEFVYPTEQSVYTMKFTGFVQRMNPDCKVRKEHLEEARALVGDVSEWDDWLRSTMRDACEVDWRVKTGHAAYPNDPPIYDLSISLTPFKEKSRFDPEANLQINGSITWRGPKTSDMAIRAAAEWRIGDRMAYYGIRSVSEKGWMYIISPGIITVTPNAPQEE